MHVTVMVSPSGEAFHTTCIGEAQCFRKCAYEEPLVPAQPEIKRKAAIAAAFTRLGERRFIIESIVAKVTTEAIIARGAVIFEATGFLLRWRAASSGG